jgi:hypothetical protein
MLTFSKKESVAISTFISLPRVQKIVLPEKEDGEQLAKRNELVSSG